MFQTSILLQSAKTKSVIEAISGKSGNTIIKDYRNVEVLSSYTKLNIDDFNWAIIAEIDKAEAFADSDNLATILLIITIFLTTIILILSFSFSRVIANPIHELSVAAGKISEGNLDVKVTIKSKDEIGKLGDSFNLMIVNLKDSKTSLEQEKESIQQKVNDAVREAKEQGKYLSDSVNTILTEMEKFANGDLTVHLNPKNNDDDIGKLFLGFNLAVKNIESNINEVANSVLSTVSASNQISTIANQLSAGAQEQSAQTSERLQLQLKKWQQQYLKLQKTQIKHPMPLKNQRKLQQKETE